MTRDQELELRRQELVLEEIMVLPSMFPLLRPDCSRFDRWADRVPEDSELTRDLLEAGVGSIGRRERKRILAQHEADFPHVWSALCNEIGGRELAEPVLLVGAVIAGLDERLPIDESRLELLELAGEMDPATTLSLALEPTDLWSAYEAGVVADALALLDDDAFGAIIAGEAGRLTTPRHRKQLARLVARLGSQIPAARYPQASESILRACADFERNRDLGARVAALLLGDSLGALRALDLRLAA